MTPLLDPLASLRVDEVWAAATPVDALALLGATVRWSRAGLVSQGESCDFIVEDADGGWHAFRLALRHRSLWKMQWEAYPESRVFLLAEALDPNDSLTYAPSLNGLVQALGANMEPAPDRVADSGDRWKSGSLLLGALDLVPDADRRSHETILALRDPDLIGRLHDLQFWIDNGQSTYTYADLCRSMNSAIEVLWPKLSGVRFARSIGPDDTALKDLLLVASYDFQREVFAYLYRESQDSSSWLFEALRQAWLGRRKNRVRSEESADFAPILARLTKVPAFLR